MKKNKTKAQNLVEYILIFGMIALASYAFVSHFDLAKLRNMIFRPGSTTSTTSGRTTMSIGNMTN